MQLFIPEGVSVCRIFTSHDAKLYYEEQGTGPETIVFAHGLMWSGLLFEKQVKAFKDNYRCIAFDFRGQGQSQIAEKNPIPGIGFVKPASTVSHRVKTRKMINSG